MSIVKDIIDRARFMQAQRFEWDRTCEQVARFCLPIADRFFRQPVSASSGANSRGTSSYMSEMQSWTQGPTSDIYGKEIYDVTALWGLDRMSSGVESIVTPANDKWHELTVDSRFGYVAADDEREWFEKQRDYLFSVRYDPRSGFGLANQSCIKSSAAFGTGVLFIEEAWGDKAVADQTMLPFRYRNIPMAEAYLQDNPHGVADTLYRIFTLTARQMVAKWKDKCSSKVIAMSQDQKRMDQPVTLIHAVQPREEPGSQGSEGRDAEFASYYVEESEAHLIGDGGFFEFPYAVYHWEKRVDGPYGESPVMLALAEIKSLNLLAKNALRAAQQVTRPPIGTLSDSSMNRPNLNAGAINYGAIDQNGRLKIQPIITAQPTQFVQQVLEASRANVREALYVNLWQIMLRNPKMTATEVMQRNQEKGEMLGPVGQKIQYALSNMTQRELAILERKGAWLPGSPLEPPQTLRGKHVGLKFTSPLDRLRQMPELVGTQQTVEMAMLMAQAKPAVLDRLDEDEIIKLAQQVNGAPTKIIVSDEDVAQIRQARQATQTAMAAGAAAEQVGKGVNQAVPAAQQLRGFLKESGLDPNAPENAPPPDQQQAA